MREFNQEITRAAVEGPMWLPGQATIFPTRILLKNEADLFRPNPTFQLLFPRNGLQHVGVIFVKDELIDFVRFREAFEYAFFVLPDAAFQIAGDAYVKSA